MDVERDGVGEVEGLLLGSLTSPHRLRPWEMRAGPAAQHLAPARSVLRRGEAVLWVGEMQVSGEKNSKWLDSRGHGVIWSRPGP